MSDDVITICDDVVFSTSRRCSTMTTLQPNVLIENSVDMFIRE
jgi:hypothetical protein